MNICPNKQDKCVVCRHSSPHNPFEKCSHTRFRCKQFPGKQHRCRKFSPTTSDFEVIAGIDTFIVAGIVLDAELLRLIEKYGTDARGPRDGCIRVSLPKHLFEAFVIGGSDMYQSKLAKNIKRQDDDYSILAKDLAWHLYVDHPNIHGAGWYTDKAESLEDLPSEIAAYYIEWAHAEIEEANQNEGKAGIERIRQEIKDSAASR